MAGKHRATTIAACWCIARDARTTRSCRYRVTDSCSSRSCHCQSQIVAPESVGSRSPTQHAEATARDGHPGNSFVLSIAVRVQCFRVIALLGLAVACPSHPPCSPGLPRPPDPPLPRRRPSSPRIHCPPRHHRRPHPPRLVPPPRPPRHHRPPRNLRPSHLLRIMCQSPCPNQ